MLHLSAQLLDPLVLLDPLDTLDHLEPIEEPMAAPSGIYVGLGWASNFREAEERIALSFLKQNGW